jgi:4-amino-4-deoxy-L-arabinose transferase-like glycosyltransferase
MPGEGIMRDSRFVLLLVAVSLFLFFYGLGDMALTDPDETFYAQTAREMLDAGEWTTPLIFGEPQFEKPAFYYWLVMISYMVFGVGEFAARFPSAVFGIAGVIGMYFLGRLFFSRLCGFLSGLILATCVQYIILSRGCVTDMVLMVFILFCFLFFLMGWTGGRKFYYLAASVMAAFAVLTKGPIGLFIPGMVIILYILFSRQWKALKNVPVWQCILLFLAISLPWYIVVSRIHGAAFINEFFGFHNVTRFLEPEHRIGISPFFYIPIIIGGFFPWSLFLPLGVWDMFRRGRGVSRVTAHRSFLFVWFLTVFLFFSASSTKLVTYIFPLFPVMALVTGRLWEKFIEGKGKDRALCGAMRISHYVFTATGLLAIAGIYYFVGREFPQALNGVVLAEEIFAIGIFLSLFFIIREKRLLSFSSIVLAVVVLCVPLVRYVLPGIEEFECSKAVSCKVKELSKKEEAVAGESYMRRGIAFYTGRTIIEDVHPPSSLASFVSRKGRVWGIVKKRHYDQLKREDPEISMEIVFQKGKQVVITNKPID